MKNSSETIGNRTRDLPACSAVPQRTAPPRTPSYHGTVRKVNTIRYCNTPQDDCVFCGGQRRAPQDRHAETGCSVFDERHRLKKALRLKVESDVFPDRVNVMWVYRVKTSSSIKIYRLILHARSQCAHSLNIQSTHLKQTFRDSSLPQSRSPMNDIS